MLGNEIQDAQQLKAIKLKMKDNPELRRKFKSLYFCGSKVLKTGGVSAVALLANDKTARFAGVTSCKSAWFCPVCAARQMSKYAAKISCAIEALKERGLSAAMLTFTVPHTSGFTCEQTTEILYKVWAAFTIHGNKIQGTAKNDAFSKFNAEFNAKHRVKVCEYTWGLKGWHPHFHCLFWFPSNRIQEILEWEEKLNERWLHLCKTYTIRQLLLGYPETQRKTVRAQVETRINIMYSRLNDESQGVYISKENGKVIIQESSNYLCGWGGDKEVTGNCKSVASHAGHFTWQQILTNAIESDQLHELQPVAGSRKKEGAMDGAQVQDAAKLLVEGHKVDWWALFWEYAWAVRKYKHHRINFSVQSGLSKIIAEYRNTQGYKEILKKNHIRLVQEFGSWRVVCFFTAEQWKLILLNNLEIKILELAKANFAKKLIDELLEIYDIPPTVKNESAAEKLEVIWNAA